MLDWSDAPFAKWFVGGRLNATVNCLDRHVAAGHGDQVAIHFEGEPGDTRTVTYADLLREVQQGGARADRARRARRGPGRHLPADDPGGRGRDARLRAHRRTALGGLRRLLRRGAALAHRGRARPSLVITADGGYRRGSRLRAQAGGRRGGRGVAERAARPGGAAHRAGRRVDRQGRVVARRGRPPAGRCTSRRRSTPSTRCSSSTRRARPRSRRASCTPPAATSPRSSYTHSQRLRPQAGHRRVLVHRRRRLGHRALVHRVRAAGQRRDAGDVRGHAGHPAPGPVLGDRREVRRHDPLHRADRDPHVHEVGRARSRPGFDLSSLRLLGSVGEPINPEAWMWYRRVIGGDRCPVVDTWWQTETGAIMISPLPGRDGDQARLGDAPAARHRRRRRRQRRQAGAERLAAATSSSTEPWPSMLRGIWGDPQRYTDTYWSPLRRACTSPATARRRTRTATCGCSAGSTT